MARLTNKQSEILNELYSDITDWISEMGIDYNEMKATAEFSEDREEAYLFGKELNGACMLSDFIYRWIAEREEGL